MDATVVGSRRITNKTVEFSTGAEAVAFLRSLIGVSSLSHSWECFIPVEGVVGTNVSFYSTFSESVTDDTIVR